jgi:hypothetical protein
MNSKILVLLSLASVLLLVGCKSEGDKIVEKACDLDLRESENQDICVKALASNCGEFYKEADAAQNELYRLKHWKTLFLFEKKGDMNDEEKAKVKEAETELKEKEQAIRERWDKLPLTSTCKDALENLYDIHWKMMKEKMDKEIREKSEENTDGLFSTIISKIKGIFTSNKSEKTEITEKDVAENEKNIEKKSTKAAEANAVDQKNVEPVNIEKTQNIEQNKTDTKNEIKDTRDGNVYQTVDFKGKIWISQNMNYAADGSICYDNASENCERYGRLYDWTTAKKACPQGWHLPSEEEWLDAPLGIWNTFAGYYYVTKGVFYKKDAAAYYWTSTENDPEKAVDMDMNADSEAFVKKSHSKTDVAFSVRCIKD